MQFPFIVLEVSERKLQEGTKSLFLTCALPRNEASLVGPGCRTQKSHGLPHSRSAAEQGKSREKTPPLS